MKKYMFLLTKAGGDDDAPVMPDYAVDNKGVEGPSSTTSHLKNEN